MSTRKSFSLINHQLQLMPLHQYLLRSLLLRLHLRFILHLPPPLLRPHPLRHLRTLLFQVNLWTLSPTRSCPLIGRHRTNLMTLNLLPNRPVLSKGKGNLVVPELLCPICSIMDLSSWPLFPISLYPCDSLFLPIW
jgi:hypothetical protein